MPIQYSPFPEFQAPNINFLGALAQGQASRLQELQAQKLAQQTAATISKEEREADKFKAEQEKLNYELSAKKYDSLIDMVPRLNEKNYGAWYKQVSETFPLAAATLPPAYDQEAIKFLGLKGADLKDQVLEQHIGPTSRYLRIGPTGAARPIEGSEVSAPTEWEPIKQGDFIIGYKSKYGTQQITPEEFQSLSQRQKRSEGPSTQEVAEYINQRAPQMGVDPRVANRVFTQGEYGGKYVGDQGSSFGPTQLHYGGMAPGGNRVAGLGDEFTKATGLDARDPSTWREQIDFSLGQAAKGGWGPWHAAKKVGVGEYEGINAMAPRQVASAGPMNGMLAPPMQLPNAAPQPQAPIVRPQLKSYAPAPIGTEEASDQKSALKFLNAIEYDPETGSTRPGTLLESTSGGRPTQILYGLARALGISTAGTRAEAGLSSSQINTLLAKVGSLGGKSFTDEDRKVVKEGLGGLEDTAVPIGDRLAKFNEAIRLMTNVAGVPYKPPPQLERLKGLAAPTPPTRGKAGETAKPSAPQAGAVEDGYRFKGGDPSNPANWEKQ